jgi:hypothetical protein
MDMGFQRAWTKPESAVSNFLNANAATFLIGNLNVYFDAQPVKNWRGPLEVRFTNAPQGNIESLGGLGGTFKRTNTYQTDPNASSLNAPMWGGYTVPERNAAHGQAHDMVTVSLGARRHWRRPGRRKHLGHEMRAAHRLRRGLADLRASATRLLHQYQLLGRRSERRRLP